MGITNRLVVVLLIGAIAAACAGTPAPTSNPSVSPQVQPTAAPAATQGHPAGELAMSNVARDVVDPSLAKSAAAAANAFGLDLFAKLRAGAATDNIVFSPTSIALALAMARAGARGQTAAQMDAVLHGLGSDDQAPAINALDAALNSRSGTFQSFDGKSYNVTLSVANAPFAQRDEQWQQAFLDALAQRFGAGLRLVDYKSDPDGARVQINQWVSDKTNGRIPELISQGMLDTLTRLVLVNAIYLKAPWAQPFDPNATQDKPFSLLDGSSATVPTMAMTAEQSYASGQGWQAVDLPYVLNKLALTIILPADFNSFAAGFTADKLDQITSSMKTSEVDLTLPRFDTQTTADLSSMLGGLGMPLAFDPNTADFSGMTTQEPLYIAFVIHQANITVDEKGTEAAAATAVGVSAGAMPVDVAKMHVDHPFLFALRDLDTGAVLFMGQVTDPSATS
ncbi:MAG TPA: serpin family protein [Candidatus Limnocylindrales bacterium]